ncbi:MAG: glycosyltransferase family 39 protein [Candidatus Omnitrophica bacterium]|nr:glycosyltransferase family 39 protein [Candidatus Omnitrophota bacterium]
MKTILFKFFARPIVKALTAFLVAALIVVFSFLIRANTFWLPHWMGDQSHYVTLAMKLEKLGFEHYNLRGVRIKLFPVQANNRVYFVYPYLSKDLNERGEILSGLAAVGIPYYDQPFFHKPPAFSYALVYAHKLIAKKNQPYIVVMTNIARKLDEIKPNIFKEVQLWAVVVPLFFSLVTVFLTFVLGKLLFSYRIGIYSAFLMAINPVEIMASQKLWTDTMLTCFILLALILFILGKKRKAWPLFLLSGISCGIGVLTKQTAGYFLIAIWIFTIAGHDRKLYKIKEFLRVIFNREIIFFTIGVFFVSGYWFWKIYSIYGHPLWLPPHAENLVEKDVTKWFQTLSMRPPGIILYTVGLTYICPLFVFAYLSFKRFIVDSWSLFFKRKKDYNFVLLWIVILVFYGLLFYGREHRYMMPVYPLFAVLAAYYIEDSRRYSAKFLWALLIIFLGCLFILLGKTEYKQFLIIFPVLVVFLGYFTDKSSFYRGKFKNIFYKNYFSTAVFLALAIFSLFWSLPIAKKIIFANDLLMNIPF